VTAGDDKRMEGSGGAKVLRPNLFETGGFTDQRGLHHGDIVRASLVERFDALEGSDAKIIDERPET
jgi:hypothetical protein